MNSVKVKELIETLIKESINHRLDYALHADRISPINYAYEFKTVGLILPRASGKTKAIKQLVSENYNSFSIAIVNSEHISSYEYKDINSLNVNTIKPIFFNGIQAKKYQFIFIDEITSQSHIDLIYQRFNNPDNPFQTFIRVSS